MRLQKRQYIKLIDFITSELQSRFSVSVRLGAEIEFYLNSLENNKIVDTIVAIHKEGLRVDKEKGCNQYEIVTGVYSNPLELADALCQIKYLIKQVSGHNQVKAIFLPKPFKADYGSAMHLNISLHNESGHNLYSDSTIDNNRWLSRSVAGILEIAIEGMALLCETESEFKRFVPKFMSPTHLAWGGNNRTTVIRIPESLPEFRRVEFRLASANSNPYALVFICLFGILEGLQNEGVPPTRVFGNAYDPQYALEKLPSTLKQAKEIFEKGKIIHNFINSLSY